ncbi:hypothetical protein HK097_003468 [Rhizophlyctis rosea]|uniref:sn-1-specific diacylglycerol lipase n=1 Tax=Rhizophlyctis rosea TaxID=64517 RepID=A0AAD5S2K3_9FUNG|nr:hypothetical protein HK097_003468 [Rhizophlyctis rosea]
MRDLGVTYVEHLELELTDRCICWDFRHFLHFDAILLVCALAIQITGIVLLSSSAPEDCSTSPNASHANLLYTILTSVSTLSTFLWLLALLFLFLSATPTAANRTSDATLKTWKRRLNIMFFGHRVEGKDVMSEIARFFAGFFEGFDMAASDFLVGCVLLSDRQKRRKGGVKGVGVGEGGTASGGVFKSREGKAEEVLGEGQGLDAIVEAASPIVSSVASPITSDGFPSLYAPTGPTHRTVSEPPSPTSLASILHYFQYAEAIYGLPLHLVTQSPFQWFRSRGGCGCCPCVDLWCGGGGVSEEVGMEGDEKTRAWWSRRKRSEELIYISRSNGLFRSPFFISRDPTTRSIVIAVRGTLSTADVVIDLSLHLTELDLHVATTRPDGAHARRTEDGGEASGNPGDEAEERHWAHTGIYRTARNIAEEIERVGALEVKELKGKLGQRWGLVVCGHSLGAGIAALLCHILLPKHPHAIAYAYSPPGCLLSSAAASYFSAFCTSVVLGDDIVPRLSGASLERIKREIKVLVEGCDKKKVDVLAEVGWRFTKSLFWGCLQGKGKKRRKVGVVEGTSDANLDLEKQGPWEVDFSGLPMQMYVPGRVLHFEKIRSLADGVNISRPSSSRGVYGARWASREEFCEIVVSGTTFTDHLPFNVRKAIDMAARCGVGEKVVGVLE